MISGAETLRVSREDFQHPKCASPRKTKKIVRACKTISNLLQNVSKPSQILQDRFHSPRCSTSLPLHERQIRPKQERIVILANQALSTHLLASILKSNSSGKIILGSKRLSQPPALLSKRAFRAMIGSNSVGHYDCIPQTETFRSLCDLLSICCDSCTSCPNAQPVRCSNDRRVQIRNCSNAIRP
jgi:hypothetical protein